MFAAAAAVAFQWLLLRGTFLLMRPATAKRIVERMARVRGAAELARALATER
jgi:hypothetical protein